MPASARKLVLFICVAATPWLTLADDARVSAVGGQFQVNTYTTDRQDGPRVGVDAEGNFVVVWESRGSSGSDAGSGFSVQGQRFASSGAALGSEFQINTYTTSDQRRAAVDSTSAGDFVVVWDSELSAGPDTSGASIRGQRFASDGSPVGGEFLVNSLTIGNQYWPDVTVDDSGDFVVVWHSISSPGSDVGTNSIQAQRFASDGSALGSQFQVNTYTTAAQRFPKIAAGSNGDFVVVWVSEGSAGTDQSSFSVQGQRFASDGSALGGEFQVNAYTPGAQSNPSVDAAADGSFVVAWESGQSPGNDSLYQSVQAQRYASDGSLLGDQFQVNTYTSGSEFGPAIALDADGNFTVVWTGGGTFGNLDAQDGSRSGVVAQRFASDGSTLGSEMVVNTYTTDYQNESSIAAAPYGHFVVVWRSEGSPGTDSADASIQGQRFELFADLQITKDDGVTSADPGGTVTYTIVATNNGPDAASPVTVSDLFPADLTCSWTSMAMGGGTGNTDSSGDLMDTLAMPASSSVTYSVTCDIDAGASGTLSNTATISSPLNDSVPADNSATDDDTALTPQADLAVVKTGTGVAEPSSELVYTLAVTNNGPLEATFLTLTDTLPAGTTYGSASGPGFTCGEAGGIVTCTRASLTASASVQVKITVTAPASEGTIANTANISGAEADFDGSNDSSTFETAIVGPIFTDGFESGNTSQWSTTIP